MFLQNSYPFRLLCRKRGCQTVFSEEIVAMKLITCTRKVNGMLGLLRITVVEVLGTIDFIDNKNDLVFQTTADEKEHLVFQLGVPTPELAIQAAKVVYVISSCM